MSHPHGAHLRTHKAYTHAHKHIPNKSNYCAFPRKHSFKLTSYFVARQHPGAVRPDTVTWIRDNKLGKHLVSFVRPFITQDSQGSFICTMPVIWQHHGTNEWASSDFPITAVHVHMRRKKTKSACFLWSNAFILHLCCHYNKVAAVNH